MTVAGTETKTQSRQSTSTMASNSLYISLNKEHRVSRSFRASWFLKMLSQVIDQSQIIQSDTYTDDFGLLSVVGTDLVSPSTLAFYICQQYSLVFVIDMSINMMAVSNSTYSVKLDDAISSLCACLELLTQPFHAPDSGVMLEPLLCVTVLAYCGHTADKPINVLLQGVYLNKGNCASLIAQLKTDLKQYENSLAKDASEKALQKDAASGTALTDDPSTAVCKEPGDTSLEGMVKAGTLAIQLLPRSALKGLIMLTDGISGFSSPATMHSTVNSMRGANISCWVVQVGGTNTPTDSLGLIPDIETLQFIARACNGAVMAPNKILSAISSASEECHTPNNVQQAILFWTFQQSSLDARVRGVVSEGWAGHDDQFTPITHQVFYRGTVSAPLLCVVGCKIREGFFLKDVDIKELVIEVTLYYPWQPSVNIYYTIVAPWPVSEVGATLQVVTSYDGPYSFVVDIQNDLSPSISSTYRIAAIRKFKQTLQKFSSSDVMLAHFLSFAATPTYHTLPQSIQDGIPMFYLPLNKPKPVPSIDINSPAGKGHTALFQFWRPLCTIDTSQWFRWFHSDKIVLILHQDSTLPRNLLQPLPNGRYSSVQCRIAALKLFEFLKSWSSVILLENHSFIRFLPSTDSPQYFCLVRVAQKHPCVVLHIGHIEGTPHTLQMLMVQSLRVALKELSTVASERVVGSRKRSMAVVKGRSCATMIDKQLQRVMIRYDAVPGGSGSTPSLSITDPLGDRLTQMDYFHNTRWQWIVPFHSPVILNALLRRRLKEGYRMTSTKNGIVTLAAQLTMEQPGESTNLKLLLQYVIFPLSEPLSSELWVEPQYGTVSEIPSDPSPGPNSSSGLDYLLRCSHDQIKNKIQEADLQLVTEVGSFLYLLHSCREREGYLSPATPTSDKPRPLIDNDFYLLDSADVIGIEVPFQLSSLFTSSRVVSCLLDVFSEDTSESYLNLITCSYLNQTLWTNLTDRLRQSFPTEVSYTDSAALVGRLASSSLHEIRALSEVFASRNPSTLWKCSTLAKDDSVCMVFVAKFFIEGSSERSSGDGVIERRSGKHFVLPIIVMQCSQSHVMDIDPARPNVPALPADSHTHMVLGTNQIPDLGDLAPVYNHLSVVHKSSYLTTLHTALVQNVTVQPGDFQVALEVCSKTALSVDITPLIGGLCSHSVTKLLDDSDIADCSAPLNTNLLCELLTAVSSKRTGSCNVSIKQQTYDDDDSDFVSQCDLLHSEINQAFNRYLSELGFSAVPKCPAHFWLNGGRAAAIGTGGPPSGSSEVSGSRVDLVIRDGSGSMDRGKDRGWSQSSAGTTSISQDTSYEPDSPHAGLKHQQHLAVSAPEVPILPSSPLSTTDTLTHSNKHSYEEGLYSHTPTGSHSQSDMEEMVVPRRTSTSSSSDEFGMDFHPLLSPPSVDEGREGKRGSSSSLQWPLAPLFLKLMCRVESEEERGGESRLTTVEDLPLCLKNCLGDLHAFKNKTGVNFTVSVELVFLSFSSPSSAAEMSSHLSPEKVEGMAPSLVVNSLVNSDLPPSYRSTANSLKNRLQWLVSDELISAACEATPITTPLLQSVAAHVQATHRMSESCFVVHIPLRFVFGANQSKTHFIEQLEMMDVPQTYSLNMIDEYCYIKPKKLFRQQTDSASDIRSSVPDFLMQSSVEFHDSSSDVLRMELVANAATAAAKYHQDREVDRSKTPPPTSAPPPSRSHRRSLSSGYPSGHVPILNLSARHTPTLDIPLSQATSAFSIQSQISIDKPGNNDSYDASDSCSVSSVSEACGRKHGKVRDEIGDNIKGFWLVLRILPQKVDLYFQLQNSRQGVERTLVKLRQLCEQVKGSVAKTCHQTNQWFLLRDMLETKKCSPYLMSVSASEAWVNTVVKQEEKLTGQMMFDAEEFRCEQMWKTHITPHWRLKAMKTQAALKITRTALNMFTVSNRRDMYVLQDVKPSGEETIFYLKIDESLCQVDSEDDGVASQLDDSLLTTGGQLGERCETRATVEAAESMSSYSMQQSISELQVPELERQMTSSSLDLSLFQSGKPQESIVLQLYGITKPTPELKERLVFMIQSKLDDAVLEMMCGLYARNQQLKLHPADVQFLQPSHSHNNPTHILCISIPGWVDEVGALFFYFLQSLTSLALRPKYFSSDERDHFQVLERLHNAYLVADLQERNLFKENLQDHIFLYVRPPTKGRGMAVITVTLNDSTNKVIVPQPGVIQPQSSPFPLDLDSELRPEEQLECSVIENSEININSGYSLQFQVWEKGNIGLSEFSSQLSNCFKQALLDYLFELYLLPQPVAKPLSDSFDARDYSVSPFILVDVESPGVRTPIEPDLMSNVSYSRRESEELKPPSQGVSASGSRRVSTSSRRASDDKLSVGKGSSFDKDDGTTTAAKRSRTYTEQIILEIEDAVQSIENKEDNSVWTEKERRRRRLEARDTIIHDAELGNSGMLEKAYHCSIPRYLTGAVRLHSACIKSHSFSLVGNYSAQVFLSQTMLALQNLCPDFVVNCFQSIGAGDQGPFVHFTPERDWTKVKRPSHPSHAHYIAVGRNLMQWEESCDPVTPTRRIIQPWLDNTSKLPLQHFHPLDTKKLSKDITVPLQGLASSREMFVPRQRLAVVIVTKKKADVWLYNLADEINLKLKKKMEQICEWQAARAGLLHHLLAQKMGLFQHTQGRDIQRCTKLATKQCRNMADVAHLVKSNAPPPQEIVPSRNQLLIRPVHPAIAEAINLESFYQEAPPTTPPHQTADIVYNHGQQFRDCHAQRRHQAESQTLLGRVFTSWQSQRVSDSSGPVNSATISALKRMSRLLHYCTSPLLMLQCVTSSEPPIGNLPERGVASPARSRSGSKEGILGGGAGTTGGGGGGGGGVLTGAGAGGGEGKSLIFSWGEKMKEELLQVYIEYLKTLGFQAIKERTAAAGATSGRHSQRPSSRGSSQTSGGRPLHPSLATQFQQQSSLRLYKCLQRSWQGGIMLIELLFQDQKFMVKLYTLERSRLEDQANIRPEIQGLFSAECARFKDFIHVNSFMYDFHLRFLLELLNQTRHLPKNLAMDVRKYVDLIYKHNKPVPNFVRNILSKGKVTIPSPMNPVNLYRHLLAHSIIFNTQTIELTVGGAATSDLRPETIGLLINVSPQSLGPTTTPELSKIIEETQASYDIRIVAVYRHTAAGDSNLLKLVFYLLMVHKEDNFPRLTCNSPQLRASCHTHPITSGTGTGTSVLGGIRSATPSDNEGESTESELNAKVRAHRRKLGFGSLSGGSPASRVVLDKTLIDEQIRGVQTHLETTIRNALYHIRRDELWKRMLYGKEKVAQEPKPVHALFEALSYEEFRELLRLVSISPLEQLDPRLTSLRKQSKKWYKRLFMPLEVRFSENIRIFSSQDGNNKYAAIINPDWQDMFVLVQSSQEFRGHQGFSAVYRKAQEGRVPEQERLITANVEADQQHIETIVNFACSFMWASILDTTPPQPQITLL